MISYEELWGLHIGYLASSLAHEDCNAGENASQPRRRCSTKPDHTPSSSIFLLHPLCTLSTMKQRAIVTFLNHPRPQSFVCIIYPLPFPGVTSISVFEKFKFPT